MDVLKLKEYCEEKSTVPANDHEAFIAFYVFEGDIMPVTVIYADFPLPKAIQLFLQSFKYLL